MRLEQDMTRKAPELTSSQKLAVHFAFKWPAVMLAMEMGTGKTACALTVARESKAHRILVLAPIHVAENTWPTEAAKHWGPGSLEVVTLAHHNPQRQERQQKKNGGESLAETAGRWKSAKEKTAYGSLRLALNPNTPVLIALNYESLLRREILEWVVGQKWDLAVLDESQKIKAPGGKISQNTAKAISGVPRRIALTGTPMPHGPEDLWAQYRALDPRIFDSSYSSFQRRYRSSGKKFLNEEQFLIKYRSIAYEAKLGDGGGIPEAVEIVKEFRGADEARKAHSQLQQSFEALLNSGERVTAENALVRSLRMKQITSGWAAVDILDAEAGKGGADAIEDPYAALWERPERSQLARIDPGKAELLKETLEGLPSEEPVIIWCIFRADLEEAGKTARKSGRKTWEISGRNHPTNEDLRPWRTEGGALIIELHSGSVGLNLQEARYAIYYSLGFSLTDYRQSQARIRRIGQEREVKYIHLHMARSIDGAGLKAMQEQESLIERLLSRQELQIPLELE